MPATAIQTHPAAQNQPKTEPSRAAKHPAAFSPSALRTFGDCRRQYAFAYLEKPDVDEPASPHLVLGNAVHQALAFLYRLPLSERASGAAAVALAHKALRHYWVRQEGRAEAFLSEGDEADWGKAALEQLSEYCRGWRGELEQLEPLAVEDWVRAKLASGPAIVGKVDRVDLIDGSGQGQGPGLRVIDYKTGRCRIKSAAKLAADVGAQVYALAATRTYNKPVREVRFHWLKEGREVTWKLGDEDLSKAEEVVAARIGEVLGATDFSPSPGPFCRFCAYRRVCPEGTGQTSVHQLDAVDVGF